MRSPIHVFVALAGSTFAASAQPIHDDLTADFSFTANPNGPWTYAFSGAPMVTPAQLANGRGWTPHPSFDGSILKTDASPFASSNDWRPHTVAVHSWSWMSRGTPVTTVSSIQWRAPHAAVVDVSGAAWDAQHAPGRNSSWRVSHNGVVLASKGSVAGSMHNDPASDFRANLAPGMGLDGVVVAPGDVIEFAAVATTFFGHFAGVQMVVDTHCTGPASIDVPPADATTSAAGTPTFSAVALGDGGIEYRWSVEVPAESGTYVPLIGTAFHHPASGLSFSFSDSVTPQITLSGLIPGSHGTTVRLRVRVSNACGGAEAACAWHWEPCPADLSGSTDPNAPGYGVPDASTDATDFFYFLDQFVAGNLAVADLTGSSDPNEPSYGVPDGVVDAADFFVYLDLFVSPCP